MSNLAIKKGYSSAELEPFVSVRVPQNTVTLGQLREFLTASKHMVASDAFLTASLFPIHKKDETHYSWKDVLCYTVPESPQPDGTQPDPKLNGQEDASVEKNGTPEEHGNPPAENVGGTSHPHLSILSSPSSKPARVNPPELPEEHKFTPIGDPKFIKLPELEPLPLATASPDDKAARRAVPNAYMLDEDQLLQVLNINGIFCGSFLASDPSARVCTQVFSPPESLHDIIRVSDGSSIETHSTTVASHAAFAKYGFREGTVGLDSPWVATSVEYSESDAAVHAEEKSTLYSTAVYRFSRAVVHLPLHSMKPTEQFKTDLEAALSGEDNDDKRRRLLRFFSKYGHAIASEVHLGGHLHSTKITEITNKADEVKIEAELRASLGAAISATSLEVSGTYARKEDSSTGVARQSSGLTIEAVGGNTLLVSNLALWPLSLMPYTNWRVTKLSRVKLLTDIPSLFTQEQRKTVTEILKTRPKHKEVFI